MAEIKRFCVFGSFILNILCILLIVTSAATNNWVQATIDIPIAPNPVEDSLQYGLYGGTMTLRNPLAVHYDLYVVCVESSCAVSCKTTPEARRQDVLNLIQGQRPQSLECDDNTDINTSRPLGKSPVIPLSLYISVNIFLYLQLLFTLCAAFFSLKYIFQTSNSLVELHGIVLTSGLSAVMGCVVMIVWGVFFTNTLQSHLAFGYIAAQIFHVFPSIGFSYWLLLPAIIFSVSSLMLAVIRLDYARKEIQEPRKF